MDPYYVDDAVSVYHGDSLAVLPQIPDQSVDAVVTDPPYNLAFMGKGWDRRGQREFQQWCEEWAGQCLRVLKPGGHLLAFGGTRTWHRLASGVEDAGFDIRDSLAWMYGSGFPKSLDVARAIRQLDGSDAGAGWGTALKPAFEPIVVARKPLDGTVAENIIEHGTGALRVDDCRIPHANAADLAESTGKNKHAQYGTKPGQNQVYGDYSMVERQDYDGSRGRWPTNVILDESQAAVLDGPTIPDIGGPSRFFYSAKANAHERPQVGDTFHPTVKPLDVMRWLVRLVTPPGGVVLDPFAGSGTTAEACVIENLRCITIEAELEYLPLVVSRLSKPIQIGLDFQAAS